MLRPLCFDPSASILLLRSFFNPSLVILFTRRVDDPGPQVDLDYMADEWDEEEDDDDDDEDDGGSGEGDEEGGDGGSEVRARPLRPCPPARPHAFFAPSRIHAVRMSA